MKNWLSIAFIFIFTIVFTQQKEFIPIKGNISNPKGNIFKSLTLIDQRQNFPIGILPFGESQNLKEIDFETPITETFSKWYSDSNHKGGKYEFILVLKKLNARIGEKVGKETEGEIEFSAQSFLKNGEDYQFLYKKDTIFYLKHKNISEAIVKNLPSIFSVFVKKSYATKPLEQKITENELSDYEHYIRGGFEAFKTNDFKDGIYKDYLSFFNQTPEPGTYVIERNENDKVTKAIKTENGKTTKIPASEMFCYVENKKIYKKTRTGFIEMFKNEKGFYINSNRTQLFGIKPSFAVGFYGMYGGIGIAIIGSIEKSVWQKKESKKDIYEIYIDPLTGEYDVFDF